MLFLEVFLQFDVIFKNFLDYFKTVCIELKRCYQDFESVLGIEVVSDIFISQ